MRAPKKSELNALVAKYGRGEARLSRSFIQLRALVVEGWAGAGPSRVSFTLVFDKTTPAPSMRMRRHC